MKKSLFIVLLSLLIVATGVCTLFGLESAPILAEEEAPIVTYIETEQDFIDFLTLRHVAKAGDKYILTSDVFLSRFYDGGNKINTVTQKDVEDYAFKAIFDGRGHAIVGLEESLFGTIGETGVVKDLQLLGVEVETAGIACALAYNNKGTISGVEMAGTLNGGATAGLVANNTGTITDVKVVGSIAKTGEAHYPIANPIDEKLTSAYYYDVTLGVGTLDTVFNDNLIKSYLEFNYYLAKGEEARLGCSLNLYGTPFIGVEEGKDLTAYQGELDDQYNLFNLRELSYTYEEFAVSNGSFDFDIPTAQKPNGEGTKDDPYRISNVSEFLYLGNLASDEYAILVSNVNLNRYAFVGENDEENVPVIPVFNGYLDGCGRVIERDANGPIFGVINGKGTQFIGEGDFFDYVKVSDVCIVNKFSNEINGYLYNVSAHGVAIIAEKLTATGMIARSETNNSEAGFVLESAGIILGCRDFGGGKFVTTENEGSQVVSCYQECSTTNDYNILQLENVSDSIYFDGTDYHYSDDIDLSCFPSVGLSGTKYLYNDNWAFGGQDAIIDSYTWAHVKGIKEDMPVLVFPVDNLSYKSTTQFNRPYTSASDTFGKINGSYQMTIVALPAGSDVSAYSQDEDKANLYYNLDDENLCYELLSGEGATISKGVVEHLIKKNLSYEVSSHLSTKALNWKYENGTEYVEDSYELNASYHLTYQDEIVYLDVALSLNNEGVATLKWNVIEEGTGEYKILTELGLLTLQSIFEELNLPLVEETNPNYSHILKKYEGVDVTITTENGSIVDGFIVGVGSYNVEIKVPSTENTSQTIIRSSFNRSNGRFNFEDLTISNSLGGISEEDALTYGDDFTTLADSFNVLGTNYSGIRVSLQNVNHVIFPSGEINALVSEIKDAGIYSLSVLISVEGYQEEYKEVTLYVQKRQVAIDLRYDGTNVVNLNYLDDLEEGKLSYSTVDDVFDVSINASALSYYTDYQAGSNVGDYHISFKLLENEENAFLNNFDLIRGTSVNVIVNPLALSFNESALSEEITYDGLSHQVVLSEDAISRPSNDVAPLSYACVYTYAEQSSATPFTFKNVGEYAVEVAVSINSENYEALPAATLTLKINYKEITITADNVEAKFNEDAVYTATIGFVDGVATQEDYERLLFNHYTLSSLYQKGVTEAGEELEITLTISDYEESLEGKIIGNYIVVNSSNGILTVGKKNYVLNMVYSYVYTGEPVALDFNGEIFEGDATYTFKSVKDNGAKVNFTGTPRDVLGVGYVHYEVTISISETKGYYATTQTREFIITPKSDDISGLYIVRGDSKVKLSEATFPTYDGKEYSLTLDYSEFSYAYTIIYHYSVYDKASGEYVEKTSTNPLTLKNAIKMKNIYVEMKGNNNHFDYVSEVTSSFEIKPKELALTNFSFKSYRGTPYTDEEISKWANELSYISGYEPIEGETVTFKAENVQGIPVLEPTGSYAIKITPLDDNYVMTERCSEMILTVVNGTANVNLDEVLPVQYFEYGELVRPVDGGLPYVEREIVYALAEEARAVIKLYVKVEAHQGTVITPGVYDVDGAEPITGDAIDPITGEPYVFVNFNLTKCEGKIVVDPMKITYSWQNISYLGTGIKSSYEYNGKVVDYPEAFNKNLVRSISGRSLPDNPQVNISLNATSFKHAGEYLFTASTNFTLPNDEGEEVNCYEIVEDVKTFTSTITKKSATYSVVPVALYVGDNLPSIFSFELNGKVLTDTVTPTFIVEGFDNTIEGDYSVEITIKVNDGGQFYDDYQLTKIDASAKEVSVRYREFDSSLNVNSLTTNYNRAPVEVPVVALPEGATVTYSQTPTNAGTYTITVAISKPSYRTKEFTVMLVIKKGTPFVQFSGVKEMPYDVNHTLGTNDVEAVVTYLGEEVAGSFVFRSSIGTIPALAYGTWEYTVDFTPDDLVNYDKVSDLKYTITTTVAEEDYKVTFGGVELPDVIEGNDGVSITLYLDEKLLGVAELVINGEPSINTTYTFTESEEIVLVEIMLHNKVLFSKTIKVIVNKTVVEPEDPNEPMQPVEPEEPDEPQTPTTPSAPENGEGDEVIDDGKGGNLGLIIGLSVGGAVLVGGGVALTIILIRKKGNANG